MKDYELVVIIKNLESGTEETVKNIKNLLESKNIKINKEDVWGLKTLAYPIKKEKKGYYIIFNISGEIQNIKSVENSLRINENLLRYRLFKYEIKIDKKIKTRRKK